MKCWLFLCAVTIAILAAYAANDENDQVWGAGATESTSTTTTAALGSKRIYKPISLLASIYYTIADAIIRKLMQFIIKKQKQKLEQEEPILYSYKKTFKIPYKAVSGEITIEDPVLENVSKFELQQMESNKRENVLNFEIYYPKLRINKIKHQWVGIILGYSVKGKGKIDTETTELVFNGTLRYELVNMTLQIADLNLNYRFEKFKMNTTGINIPFLSRKKIDETLTKEFEKYLKSEEPSLSAELAKQVKEKANEKMKALTIRALLKRLWEYLTSWTKKKNQDQDQKNQDQDKKTFDDLSNSLKFVYNAP